MKFVLVLVCIILLISCEKNISFKTHTVPNILVVDASIENNQPPVITLSKSYNYFSEINPAELDSSFVHNAEVTLSNGTVTQKLKEYSIDSAGGYKIFFYSVDTANITSVFFGQFNTSYSLNIVTNGIAYTSSTSIPPLAKKIDSLWWKPVLYTKDTTEVNVISRCTDPKGLGNYVRYFTKINNGRFLPGLQSVFDDEFIDGTTYDLQVAPGIDRNNPIAYDKKFFHRGDTVTVKLSNIDKNTYEFWLTMEFAYQSIGNPFASPNTVLGNISNGALGAFCGYASGYKTLIIPK